jgi:hypothetical protein
MARQYELKLLERTLPMRSLEHTKGLLAHKLYFTRTRGHNSYKWATAHVKNVFVITNHTNASCDVVTYVQVI